MKNDVKIQIINQAYSLIKNEYVFLRSSVYLQNSFYDEISRKDYDKLGYTLKAMRQDFAKILTVMNTIDKTYSQYKHDDFIQTYSVFPFNQALEELGCFIEYLFAKYRVILEYIYQIMEICILPRFDDVQCKQYKKLHKSHEKYEFLLRYVDENIDQTICSLDIEWFQEIREDRNDIIHDGATCLVYGDKTNLLFSVMTTDVLDQDEDKPIIDYVHFWGLYISKLIVFAETIMRFLIEIGNLSADRKECIDSLLPQDRNKHIDGDDEPSCDKQYILDDMLKKLLVMV